MKKKKNDFLFECGKCQTGLYCPKTIKDVEEMIYLDCPECGEEAGNIWVLVAEGNFKDK